MRVDWWAWLTIVLATFGFVLLMVAPWIYGPGSARMGGTAVVALLAAVVCAVVREATRGGR